MRRILFLKIALFLFLIVCFLSFIFFKNRYFEKSKVVTKEKHTTIEERLNSYNQLSVIDFKNGQYYTTMVFSNLEDLVMPIDIGDSEIVSVYNGYSLSDVKRNYQVAALIRSKKESNTHFYCVIGLSCTPTSTWPEQMSKDNVFQILKKVENIDIRKKIPDKEGLIHLEFAYPSDQNLQLFEHKENLKKIIEDNLSPQSFESFYEQKYFSYLEINNILIPIEVNFEQ